jgi:hypothetical protein
MQFGQTSLKVGMYNLDIPIYFNSDAPVYRSLIVINDNLSYTRLEYIDLNLICILFKFDNLAAPHNLDIVRPYTPEKLFIN